MLQPKRVKYRKVHRGRLKGGAHSGNSIAFGEFGLRAEESAWITAQQIEATRRVLVRYIRPVSYTHLTLPTIYSV